MLGSSSIWCPICERSKTFVTLSDFHFTITNLFQSDQRLLPKEGFLNTWIAFPRFGDSILSNWSIHPSFPKQEMNARTSLTAMRVIRQSLQRQLWLFLQGSQNFFNHFQKIFVYSAIVMHSTLLHCLINCNEIQLESLCYST